MTILLSKRQVLAMLSISKATLDRWRRDRGFPAPVSLFGINRWRWVDIEGWIRAHAVIRAKPGLTIDAVLPEPSGSSVSHRNANKPKAFQGDTLEKPLASKGLSSTGD